MAASSVLSTSSVFPHFQNTSAIAAETNPFISEKIPEHIKRVIELIASGDTTRVNFRGHLINLDAIPAIAWALTSPNCKLEILDLGCNEITDADVEKISLALASEHCSLNHLDLSSNQIGNAGAEKLALALLSEHCTLNDLSLWHNQISDAGIQKFILALTSEHCTLVSLYLSDNQISDVGAEKFARIFSSENFKLSALTLSGNNMTETGIKTLLEALKTNHTLEHFYVSVNDSESDDVLSRNQENTIEREINLFSLLFDKVIRA